MDMSPSLKATWTAWQHCWHQRWCVWTRRGEHLPLAMYPLTASKLWDRSLSGSGGLWDSADLSEQAQSVPVDPFFNESAIDNPAEELSIHIDRLASGSGAFQFPSMRTAQGPMGFDHIALGDLTLDPQIEAVEDAAITAHSLLESLWTSPLVGVVRIVVHVIRGVQLIDGGPVNPVPDFIKLTADEHLALVG
jgi:hypothetical protein